MIRAMQAKDIPALRAMGFAWECGSDFLCGMVKVNAEDKPLMVMAAWAKAEVHMASSPFSTPAVRWETLREMHDVMEQQLAMRGIRETITWFDKAERFCKRMIALQWVQSSRISFHRRVHGVR